jgi:predicted dehydrogenase
VNGFRRIPHSDPVRVLLVGAGGMGRTWLDLLRRHPDTELVGIADLDVAAARRAAAAAGLPTGSAAASLTELAAATRPEAVVNVTAPAAHHPVTLEALGLGLPVLGEKPLAATLPEAVELVAAADRAGLLFMVSQNRRYEEGLWHLKDLAHRLGGPGILTHEFFKAPRFGGFRDAMAHPLLLDMAIHNFDAARFLLDADPVAVYCEEFNPEWSWYAGDAATTAIFEMTGGVRFVYTGSWCSPGLETSWNSSWRVSARHGSARWDGESAVATAEFTGESAAESAGEGGRPNRAPHQHRHPHPSPPATGIAGSLSDFVRALRTGEPPATAARDNLLSLAMVHAAMLSSAGGTRVRFGELLGDLYPEGELT